MSELKATLKADLTSATKASDKVTLGTLRMALTAITNEEVSGKESRELTDEEIVTVLGREAKKRRESIEAYNTAGRSDLADIEAAELVVLEKYLPKPLSADEVDALINSAVEAAKAQGLEGMKAMGAVMKVLTPQVNGRADGGAVAAAVKKALGA
ncbi:MAG: hypothetical protein RIS75_1411 [Actinomycetota bacterium]|jgi:uncharacterized protein YqeY